jgi:gentisate 1,2-dioxygenase
VKLFEQLNANAHSQAQWQVAQANAKAKTCHRAWLFSYPDLPYTKKLNLLRQRKRNDRIEKISQTIERQ